MTTLTGIWERHRVTILRQVDVIDAAVETLTRGQPDEARLVQAQREAHKLAGSLGTLGFGLASDCALEIERVLRGHADLRPGDAETLGARAEGLRAELERAPVESPQRDGASDETAPLVLIVDDDATLAERLAAEAERRGLRVELASSPADARRLAARERPALVLLDLTFDGETDAAYELLSGLTRGPAPVPVVALTVRDSLLERVEVARRGGRGFVSKSVSPQQTFDQVMLLIERAAEVETTLLAVDDDPVLLAAVKALLEPEGVGVRTLSNPMRFWEELERVRPDIVLLDVDMPGVNGVDLCRVLRNDRRWATAPVLFLTAHRDERIVKEMFAAGADDYLLKPVRAEELLVRIRNRLDRFKLHRLLAETDALTGVPNRASSTHGFERMLRMAKRLGQPVSVAILDLDRFKAINDHYGHAAGDAVLRRLGELLLRTFRGEDIVGRWGGEEFIVGMYAAPREDGIERLRATLAAFADERFDGALGERFGVTFSSGVAVYPNDGADLPALQRTADAALYRAKAAGRACIGV
jgi:diguanylate cyclase (GGDEF)-like protein